jgi:putative acetyltransferase
MLLGLYAGNPMLITHPEQPADIEGIRAVHAAAFPTDGEARLVDLLRDTGQLAVSRVAVLNERLVGHVAFSPVTVEPATGLRGLGLGPVGVRPEHQRRGIGSQLIRQGLADCHGWDFVVVLGDPGYYRRFGFTNAKAIGLLNDYGADEHFMVLSLSPRFGARLDGRVHYAPQFASLEG